MTARLLAAAVTIVSATIAAGAATGTEAVVSVQERGGIYTVAARFTVPEAVAVVREVLTDYAGIPRFMPDVRTSRVLERGDGFARVEQHAVAKYMMFSRDIHLVLDIEEGPEVIRFGDTSATSFTQYSGAWTIAAGPADSTVEYVLTAKPAFSVPGFVLRRLLDRDARVMIDRLRIEFTARAHPE